jgi:hypothetical protein
MVTFANLGDKAAADGFDEEPTARVLALMSGEQGKSTPKPKTAQKAAQKPQEAPSTAAPAKGLDLDALLGD